MMTSYFGGTRWLAPLAQAPGAGGVETMPLKSRAMRRRSADWVSIALRMAMRSRGIL
jgi:hypothetical protein